MQELKYYVYCYLNPLKKGKYEYLDQGLGISFDYEPFYIGEGTNSRIESHLKETRKEKSKDPNKYKINTIKKILRSNLNPIIYKIAEFENEQDALNVERTLGFLIGRKDQKRGPLTNLVDCGQKTTNLSEESRSKKSISLKKAYEKDPSITERRKQTREKTMKADPSIGIKLVEKAKKTKQNFSLERRIEIASKISSTLLNKDDEEKKHIQEKMEKSYTPKKRKEAGKKCSATKKNKPNDEKNRINNDIRQTLLNKTLEEKRECLEKRRETIRKNPLPTILGREKALKKKRDNPDIMKIAGRKCSRTSIYSKCNMGKNNSNYKKINFKFIIILYFQNFTIKSIIKEYNLLYEDISSNIVSKVLIILNFPLGGQSNNKKKTKLDFIEENKNNIQWYIDNYERLEEEYFENKWKEKYGELLNDEEKQNYYD